MAMCGDEQANCVHKLPRGEAIARLNDKLRKGGVGGQFVVTSGVHGLPGYDSRVLLQALAGYDSFDADNDPHGERDFGDIQVFGTDLFWKIDYYDLKLEFGSSDPADPDITIRVLTVMLEHEY
jgi:Protein of unknown function (DUF3768)